MDADRVRSVLEQYLSDLEFPREDAGGILVKPLFSQSTDEGFLHWAKIDRVVSRLGGSWIKASRYMEGHWRMPK